MSDFLKLILSLSISGTILAGILLLIKPLIKARVSKAFLYYIWLVVLVRMVCPVSIESSFLNSFFSKGERAVQQEQEYSPVIKTDEDELHKPVESINSSQAQVNADKEVKTSQFWDQSTVIFCIWLLGAVLTFSYYVTAYRLFSSKVMRQQRTVTNDEQELFTTMTQGKGRLLRSSFITTPMLIGLFRPIIVIPDAKYSLEQLRNIINHEYIHLKRYDIAYKWFVLFVSSIHWVNPMMIRIKAEIGRACELSCDEAVIQSLNGDAKKSYGETLLFIASSEVISRRGLSSIPMCSNKKCLKERLILIVKYKKQSKRMILLACILGAMIILSATRLGAYALGGAKDTEGDAVATVRPLAENAVSDSPSIPTVKSLNHDDIITGVKEEMKLFWGIDLFHMDMETNFDEDFYQGEAVLVWFMSKFESESGKLVYVANIDKNTKQIIELSALTPKSDSIASGSLRDEYVSAATSLVSDKFGVQKPGKSECYLPFVRGEVKTDRTVYVFFPDLALYAELATSDYHPIGYHFFHDQESMQAFIKANCKPL